MVIRKQLLAIIIIATIKAASASPVLTPGREIFRNLDNAYNSCERQVTKHYVKCQTKAAVVSGLNVVVGTGGVLGFQGHLKMEQQILVCKYNRQNERDKCKKMRNNSQ